MNLLVADIGGTNARFAYRADNTKELSNFAYLKCSNFNNIHDAIKFYKNDNNYLDFTFTDYITDGIDATGDGDLDPSDRQSYGLNIGVIFLKAHR